MLQNLCCCCCCCCKTAATPNTHSPALPAGVLLLLLLLARPGTWKAPGWMQLPPPGHVAAGLRAQHGTARNDTA
jgi:hypothetical protein